MMMQAKGSLQLELLFFLCWISEARQKKRTTSKTMMNWFSINQAGKVRKQSMKSCFLTRSYCKIKFPAQNLLYTGVVSVIFSCICVCVYTFVFTFNLNRTAMWEIWYRWIWIYIPNLNNHGLDQRTYLYVYSLEVKQNRKKPNEKSSEKFR